MDKEITEHLIELATLAGLLLVGWLIGLPLRRRAAQSLTPLGALFGLPFGFAGLLIGAVLGAALAEAVMAGRKAPQALKAGLGAGLGDGLRGVDHEVEQGLFEQARIGGDDQGLLGQLATQTHLGLGELGLCDFGAGLHLQVHVRLSPGHLWRQRD